MDDQEKGFTKILYLLSKEAWLKGISEFKYIAMPLIAVFSTNIYSIPSDSVQSPLWSGKHESSDHGDQDSSLLLESEFIKKV